MADLNDIVKGVQRAITQLEETREVAVIGITENLIALIKLRVINTGERADGAKFSGYSEALVPFWYFGSGLKNPAFNVETKRKQLLESKGYFASYKDWREITNRRIDIKNFSFTNEMWASIAPFVAGSGKGYVDIEIRSRDPFYNETVIPANSNREGINILQANDKEIGIVREAEIRRVEKILRENGLTK